MTSGMQDKAHYFMQQITVPPSWAQALNVVGEAGEFAEAFRRYSGNARRKGSLDEVALELADVVIASYCFANIVGIDLEKEINRKWRLIFTRGYGQQTKTIK